MTSRARYEHQIKLNDYTMGGGNTFDAALNRVVSRWRGLGWFTDEQIAEIRAEMIESEWFRHKLKRQSREAFEAFARRSEQVASLSASQKETA